MAALTKTKLKQNFKESLSSEKKTKKKDERLLNYHDLPDGEKMKILFIADENGDLFKDWEVHGSNMKLRGAGTIRCSYESNGETCPSCAISYEYYQQGNKKENQRWIKNKRTLGQCVVVESPIELNDNPDDNLVYLMYVPQNVRKAVEEAVMEEVVEDPTQHLFVLKKTKNDGDYASYQSSYFIQKEYEPSEELQEAAENGFIRPYNFEDMEAEGDLIPKPTNAKEVQEWVDHVRSLEKQINETSTDNSSNDDDDDSPDSSSTSDDDDDDQPKSEQKSEEESSTGPSVREKLDRFKKKSQTS